MTAAHYALLDGVRVTGVVQQDAEPLGVAFAVLASFAGLPAGRGDLELHDGALVRVDHRTLAQAKAERVAAMREARDAQVFGTFTWDGSTFDADQVSQSRILGLLVSSQQAGFEATAWRLADNSWRLLSAGDAASVWAALQAHVRGEFLHFALRETEINAAATIAEVGAVEWIEP